MVSAPSGSVLFGSALALIGGLVLVVSARYVWRATAVPRARDVSSLADTPPGTLVRVSGTAKQASDLLTAPFSGHGCLALRYAVEERRLSPGLLPWFVTLHETAGSDAFRVRTAETVVDVVAPAHTVVLERDVVATVPVGDDLPDRIARFEDATAALPETTFWRDPPSFLRPLVTTLSLGTRRYTEQRAVPEATLTVVGRVTDADDGVDPLVVSDTTSTATVLRMAKTAVAGVSIGVLALGVGLAVLFL
jgi:hypothetical protein